jgi:hypothetical protein
MSAEQESVSLYFARTGPAHDDTQPAPRPFAELDAKDQIAAYSTLRAFESDFDRAQGVLRSVASSWVIATAGALAFLMFQALTVAPGKTDGAVDAAALGVLRQLVLAIGTFGLLALWYLDQRVYQRLLHSAFAMGCHMETACPALPPTRCFMFLGTKDLTPNLGVYYTVPVQVAVVAAAINWLFLLTPSFLAAPTAEVASCVWSAWTCIQANRIAQGIFILMVHVLGSAWLLYRARNWTELSTQLPRALVDGTMSRDTLLSRMSHPQGPKPASPLDSRSAP